MDKRHLFVISDLHLGAPHSPGDSRDALASFLAHLGQQSPVIELVINGDMIDFSSARSRHGSVLLDEEMALGGLRDAVRRDARVFDVLRQLLHAGHRLTVLMGTKDLELSFPKVRRELYQVLGGGPWPPFEFLYDNDAYQVADVLIEHGSRYDAFNAVNHDQLRQIRSLLSRRQPIDAVKFEPSAGQLLQGSILGPLQTRYPILADLHPVSAGIVPLLLALEPDLAQKLTNLIRSVASVSPARQGWVSSVRGSMGASTQPRGGSSSPRERGDLDAWLVDEPLVREESSGAHGLLRTMETARSALRNIEHPRRIEMLLDTVLRLEEGYRTTEQVSFRQAAEQLCGQDFRCALFSHAHQPQEHKEPGYQLLITGSWRGTVAWPPEIRSPDRQQATSAMRDFVETGMFSQPFLQGGLHYVDLIIDPESGLQAATLKEWLR